MLVVVVVVVVVGEVVVVVSGFKAKYKSSYFTEEN
jgi:hypothetical protein